MGKKLSSVIIPVYNEVKTISKVIDEVLSLDVVGEVIIVNDASKDNSANILKSYSANSRVKVLTQRENKGKGAAIIRGFDEASCHIAIVQNADLECSLKDYHFMIAQILLGKADIVYGPRFHGGAWRVLYCRHQLVNKFITFMSNIFSDLNFTNIETCYKVFKREVIQNIIFESDRFGIEAEITAKFAKAKILRIYEIPISYNGRTYAEGEKITWRDGIVALWHIIKFNLFRVPSSYFKSNWQSVLKTDN